MEQLFILLVLAALALGKWFITRNETDGEVPPESGERRDQTDATRRTRPGETLSEEERMRRFMEALGIPTTSEPPPKVTRRTEEPPKPLAPVRPPPVLTPQIPRRQKTEAQKQPPRRPTAPAQPPPSPVPPPIPLAPLSPPPLSVPETVRVEEPAPLPAYPTLTDKPYEIPVRPVSGTRQSADLRALLRRTDSVRQALVLREVLGPPRGLQDAGRS